MRNLIIIVGMGMLVGILGSCMTAVPPSLQVQADVGDGVVSPVGNMAMAGAPKGSRAASQTHDFYAR